MQRALSIPALALLTCAPAAFSQRGGGHAPGGARGGFSASHAAPAFRGAGGSVPRPAYAVRPGYAGVSPARPGIYGRPGGRVVARGYGYGIGYPYGYGLGFYDPAFGYDDSAFYDTTGPTPDPAASAYADPNAYANQNAAPYVADANPPAPTATQPEPAPIYRPAQPAPAAEDAVTIIFKDGRPPLEVHNYALTRTTLYVTDAKHRDIPVADLDLPATVKANADAGVPFQLPTP